MAKNAVANILRNLAKPFKPEPRAIFVQRLAAAIERIADQVDRARLRTRGRWSAEVSDARSVTDEPKLREDVIQQITDARKRTSNLRRKGD